MGGPVQQTVQTVEKHSGKLADSILAVGAMSAPAWLNEVATVLEIVAVVGGIIIIALRGWLIWQEIKRNRIRLKKEEQDGSGPSNSGPEPS